MRDLFIYRLVTCFTASVIIWALFTYAEMWINANLKNTSRAIAKLLNAEPNPRSSNPPGYNIIQGTYKGRKIVCRLNSFSPTKLLRYNLSLHVYIEPFKGSGIAHEYTSLTTVKSYFLSSSVSQDEFIQIFEELTRAAEMTEAAA